MSLIARFMAQRDVFEQAYVNGDWQALAPFFREDVVYEVLNMPFHCVIRGRDAFLAGLQRSVERFDKRCIRTVGIDPSIREEGNNVITYSGMKFERKGAPPVSSRVWEIATYRGDLIERMVDLYDAGSANEFARWMDAWGEGLDPRYVSRDQPASSAASRSASAMSSTVLALKNGSSGVVGQATVARR